jgi:di/tricarboxylate transporter
VELKEWWTRGAVVGAINIVLWMTLGVVWWQFLGSL